MQARFRELLIAGAFVAGCTTAAAAAPPDVELDKVPVTLSGCVVAGEAKDSFLLTNVVIEGTTFAPPNAFYRFNTTKGLKKHVGYRVEVKGTADFEDVDEGELRVRTDDGKIETSVSSERRTVTVEHAWFGSEDAIDLEAEVPTYKFEVEKVKRLQGNCASAHTAR